ncbi:unnamed protein product [Adineta steineri]|uniref:ABC transporter domain-containing protein n=1 Tax=Adineta steineri TaxID=433720 RepID=A0A814Q1A5_9BILA|nr:unnamed protein product [Adineta steineri]CAF1177880.1 unnamed protein product [Adineta steineri]
MDSSLKLGSYDPINANEYSMSEPREQHPHVTKTEYSPIGSSRKLKLLLQRSLRYSYRQRCCRCCPTILCELLFPFILIGLLALIRYVANAHKNLYHHQCSQNRDTTITTSLSADLIKNCFKFQPYDESDGFMFWYLEIFSRITNFVFQPITNDTNVLVERAKTRLKNINCTNIKVWNQNMDDKSFSHLLQNETENVVIIDFNSTSNLKNGHNLDYNIMVAMPSILRKNDPVDLSFLSFSHPTFIRDRSKTYDSYSASFEDLRLPEFSDVKIFIDSLLIGYQTNRNIEFEIQRKPITCTPYRQDLLFESGPPYVTTVLMFIDFVYFIPYLILLTSLIREKNTKVKEILKLLGIEPILNNFVQAIRTLFIICFLTILLCIMYKLKLNPDAYFNTVNFGVLFIGYFIYGLQLISFCIMNAQLFDKSVRAVFGTLFIYALSIFIYPFIIVWPTAIQYIFIFLNPYIAGRSIFRQAILHELAYKDVALFQTIYRHVPVYFVALIIMIVSCVFYWILSWYLEKVLQADVPSAKLKEQYGSGYKLVINKHSSCRTNDIKAELRNYLPELKVETDIFGGDVVFRTNQQPNDQFVQALHHLESMKRNHRINNYGVQNSTMDDVFLKITRDTEVKNGSGSTSLYTNTIEKQCRHVFHRQRFLSGPHYYLSQLHGLLVKTVLVRYRRWGLTLIILLLPILYNLLSNLTSQSQNDTGIFKMNFNSLNPQTILYHTDPSMNKSFLASINGANHEKGPENIYEMNENIWQKRMDRLYTYTDIYLGFNIPAPSRDKYKIEALSSNLISGYEVISIASNTFYKHALNDSNASIQTTLVYKNTRNSTEKLWNANQFNLLNMPLCFEKVLPSLLLPDLFVFHILFFYITKFSISERKDGFLSLLNISGLHPASYWLFTYLFDMIISTIWLCYLLAIYCIFYVAFEDLLKKKSSSQNVDKFLSSWDLRIQFYPLSILIALPTLPFAYLLTKLFKNDILGGITICFILIILHLISISSPVVTRRIRSTSVQKLLYWLFNIICPTMNSEAIITYILARKSQFCKVVIAQFTDDDRVTSLFKPIRDDKIGWNIIILVLHIVVLLFLLIIIDSGLLQFSFSCFYKSNFNENTLDDDVLTERHRVLGIQTHTFEDEENVDHLTVKNLVKYYSRRKLLAVDHLTFSARRGEAFGLLGYNGAGKTTTFRTVVGDIISTYGTTYIDGQSVRRRIRSTRHLGYCPQQDCSMDYLTVRDSLYLLARIRGVKTSRLKSIVETMSSLFLLDPFLNNYIHQLSGGTKRRLHTAIALIGPPSVAILDEPTTGVDPNAREQMQEIFLNAVKAKLTIILTSHSMDECERVCNRLGIMVRGQLACLGTIQHLKSKFGRGYTIEIKVRTTPEDTNTLIIQNVQRFLLSQRQYQIEVKETTHSTGLFQCGQGTPAELFQLIEENKQQLYIETYTISQTTLEHVFLSFGKQIQTSTNE